MQAPLTDEWIDEQSTLCRHAKDGAYPGQYAKFVEAACTHYLLVLKELQDFRAGFALYSKAVRAGEELYREAHPKLDELTYPDTGKMVAWLVEEIYNQRWAEYDRCV